MFNLSIYEKLFLKVYLFGLRKAGQKTKSEPEVFDIKTQKPQPLKKNGLLVLKTLVRKVKIKANAKGRGIMQIPFDSFAKPNHGLKNKK